MFNLLALLSLLQCTTQKFPFHFIPSLLVSRFSLVRILTLIAAVMNLGARQCFSLDLINLHLLQYTSRGILAIFALLLVQCVVATYAVYTPHDLLKQGYFTSHSTYTRIGGSLLQACWIFMGQLMFTWFYVYLARGLIYTVFSFPPVFLSDYIVG